jgi:hypothetical protein
LLDVVEKKGVIVREDRVPREVQRGNNRPQAFIIGGASVAGDG